MSDLVTCIECGHSPVSSKASQCPKCSKNPHGHICKFCSTKVADSQAIVEKEIITTKDRDYENGEWVTKWYDHIEYHHFHPACLNQINNIKYNCPTCSAINTSFTRSCFKCGHPFEVRQCNHCRQPVLEALAIKGVGVLGKDNYFHIICANKIRPTWQADEADAKAKVKAEQERAQRETEEARIKARQQEEKARRKQEREEFLNRLFVAIGTIIGYGLSGWLLGKSSPFWCWIILGCSGLISFGCIVYRKENKRSEQEETVEGTLGGISGITVAYGQWLNHHNWGWSFFGLCVAGFTVSGVGSFYVDDQNGKPLYFNKFFTFLVGSVSCCLGLWLSWLLHSIF
ncbi:hypothetical protein [Anabaena sp. CCY 0017]|uniref:hypothetical protein n=1 Tax=Anabaena sp. CCY 0017 TaxID=3103866 RepID=UPI0039C5AAE8